MSHNHKGKMATTLKKETDSKDFAKNLSLDTLQRTSYYIFKSLLENIFAKTFKLPSGSIDLNKAIAAGSSIFAGAGAGVATNTLTKPLLYEATNQPSASLQIAKTLCIGIIFHLAPLTLPSGILGLTAYFAIYTAGRTLIDIAYSESYDSSKSLIDNIKNFKTNKSLPAFYALDFISFIAFPVISLPILSLSTSLSDNLLFYSSIKALYYTVADKCIITPLTEQSVNKILNTEVKKLEIINPSQDAAISHEKAI